jgi:DNA-binding NarL/FixJ family response regulator
MEDKQSSLRILIADDNEFRRNVMKGRLLDVRLSSRAVAVGEHGQLAVDAVLLKEPDIVLLAIDLPHLNGVMAFSVIRKIRPGVRIVIMAAEENRYFLQHLENIGAEGYLSTDPNSFELRSVILGGPSRKGQARRTDDSNLSEASSILWAGGSSGNAEAAAASDFAYILSAAA